MTLQARASGLLALRKSPAQSPCGERCSPWTPPSPAEERPSRKLGCRAGALPWQSGCVLVGREEVHLALLLSHLPSLSLLRFTICEESKSSSDGRPRGWEGSSPQAHPGQLSGNWGLHQAAAELGEQRPSDGPAGGLLCFEKGPATLWEGREGLPAVIVCTVGVHCAAGVLWDWQVT